MKIIIPAYEPDHKLLKLIQDIKTNSNYDIIIVDDGSSSNCEHIFTTAENEGCVVLSHDINQGKGVALKTAFSYLLREFSKERISYSSSSHEEIMMNSDLLEDENRMNSHLLEEENRMNSDLSEDLKKDEMGIICADCDGQHTWLDIQKIAHAIPSHGFSIILGCRKFMGSVPLKSLIGNKLTRGIFSFISGNKITDTQTGLRGFSAHMLPWLVQLKGNHYEYEINQLLEAKAAGYDFYSIAIETIYENNNSSSHFRPIKDSIRIYLPILKFSLSSVICGALDFILLFLINYLTNNLLFSVVSARVISSICNYTFNKNLVFESNKQNHPSALIKYYILVAIILICNYLLLFLLNKTMELPLFLSKLLTEGILFSFSYLVQHKLIFTSQKK